MIAVATASSFALTGSTASGIGRPSMRSAGLHPRIYSPPTPPAVAVQAITVWLESPGSVALAEGPGYLDTLRQVLQDAQSVGGMVHDARVAAVCLYNGVSALWTADRDFSRYARLTTLNPLVRR